MLAQAILRNGALVQYDGLLVRRRLGTQDCHSNDIGSKSVPLVLRVAADFCWLRVLTACCSVAGGSTRMIGDLRNSLQSART